MANTVKFKPNMRGLEACAVGPEVQAVVLSVAGQAQLIAETISAEFTDTGEYAESFEVESQTRTTEGPLQRFLPRTRAIAVLGNTAAHAAAVEWGNEANKGFEHRPMRRTLETMEEGS